MEIRARYLLIGVFLLAVVVAGFGFVYWLNNVGGFATREAYLVRFDAPVSGLVAGSGVLFNGIRVGEVTGLGLVPDNPAETLAAIAIDAGTPIRTDTRIGLDFRGLTGVASITMTGGAASAPPVPRSTSRAPLLVANLAASEDMMGAARSALQQLQKILTDDADGLHNTIANISTFSDVLARNSGRVDSILQGLDRLTGGGPRPVAPVTYDLTAPSAFPDIDKLPAGQMVVLPPDAPVALDTQRILAESNGGLSLVFDGAQWGDTLPLLVQARIVESFEHAHYPRVSHPLDGVSADYQLLIALRKFQLSAGPDQKADVALDAKLLDHDGKIIAANSFETTAPVGGTDAAAAMAALDQSFSKVATDLVLWALRANLS